jgi:AcrR family transcriptional regulator
VSQQAAEPRPYGGVSSDERRARRRAQLLESGLELFGTRGYAASSIREVCLAASLNRRYFYESFRTREDLLRAVYDEIVAEMARTIFSAVEDVEGLEPKVRAGMTAFWTMMTADPRKVRVLTLEIIGVSEDLERHRREARRGFAAFVSEQANAIAAAEGRSLALDPGLAARGMVAATMDLLVDWMRGDVTLSVEELTEHSVLYYTLAGAAAFGSPSGSGAEASPARRRRRP